MRPSVVQHVFGPVPSRRLGMSLGVDPVPLKTCNHSYVYCQLGRTRRLVDRREPFFSITEIVDEVAAALEGSGGDSIDWITFVGSGETTLCSDIGSMIRGVKLLSKLPVAVITNGSLLHVPEVQNELTAADAVLPSLDAVTAVQAIIARHPLRKSEIRGLLKEWVPDREDEALAALQGRHGVQSVDRLGKRFWFAGGMEFPSLVQADIDEHRVTEGFG